MPEHVNLQWLDISHNYLQHLDYDFSHYPHLRTVYLHCNFLYDFNDLAKLKDRENLKTFTIHGNPISDVSNFRSYVISILPQIRKLDSVLVSNKERDNAIFLRTQIKKFPMPKNIPSPPIEKNEDEE